MDFQDITTHQLLAELGKRYKHFGFVGVPDDENDPDTMPVAHSAVKHIVDQLMVRFIVEPLQITTIRHRDHGTEHGLAIETPPPDAQQVAATLCTGLATVFREMIFCGYTEDHLENGGPPIMIVHPDPKEADNLQRDGLEALKDAVGELFL